VRRLLVVLMACVFDNTVPAAQPAADAVVLAWTHARTLPPEQALTTRYVWISDATSEDRRRTWAAVAGLVNALSLSQRVVSPKLVLVSGDESGLLDNKSLKVEVKTFQEMVAVGKRDDWSKLVLMVVDLRDYRQSAEQWDRLDDPNLEPVFHVRTVVDGERVKALAPWLIAPLGIPQDQPARMYHEAKYLQALVELVQMTGAKAPIVEGRNFVWQTAIDFDRKAGYYSWLRVKDQATFDRLVRRQKDSPVLRDAVSDSGVAKEPRFVEREGRGDGYWRTLDQVNQRAQGRRNPLNIQNVDPKVFEFDAQEVFGRLDNDFWATGLFDNKGVLQQSAPDGVGYNHKGVTNDGKIHVNLTCLGCHDSKAGNGGLMPFSPYFRNKYAVPGPLALGAVEAKVLKRFDEELLAPIDPRGNLDRLAYAAAVAQANGLTPDKYARALVDTFNAWDNGRNAEDVAREHGLKAEEMVKALQGTLLKFGTLDSVNDTWVQPKERQQRIGVAAFTESYNQLELAVRGIPAWPADVRKAVQYPVQKVVKP